MTNEQYNAMLANGSKSLRDANHTGPSPEPKRAIRNEPLGESQGQKDNSGRISISVVSARKRLIDPDNLCPKWLIDCLRYCALIPGDEPDKISLKISQRKITKDEEEHTQIEIIYP